MTHAIETHALAKRFGDTRALDGVDLHIRQGSVFGLLGPNGAGKTTTIRILATLIQPDGGGATVLGHDLVRDARRVREKVSLTGQYASVDEDLTGYENLDMIGRLYRLGRKTARKRAHELLERFDLTDAANRPVKTYSGGMRRRLDLAGRTRRRRVGHHREQLLGRQGGLRQDHRPSRRQQAARLLRSEGRPHGLSE